MLLIAACTSEDGYVNPEEPLNYELLWGKWSFSYATNTMTGKRSYTFSADGHYVYLDEWVAISIDNPAGPSFTDKKEGTYTVVDYNITSENSAEGEITIDDKQLHFIIATTSNNTVYLNLGDENYEKQL